MLAAALAFVLVALVIDMRERKIPNWLNALGLIGAIAVAWNNEALGFWFAVAVVAAFVFAFALFKAGAWAGGDGKFFIAL
ncbi:MAG: prepilin peptidase, partial [Candidatus Micrarchaeota archaeon]